MTFTSPLAIQYGCGLSAPEGWINYDSSPTLRLQRLPGVGRLFGRKVQFPDRVSYGDVLKRLPHANESVDFVYCSHVLEHLALEDLRKALRETNRVLKSGGVFRLVLPDLEQLVTAYVDDESDMAAHAFMEKTHLGIEHRPKGLIDNFRAMVGSSKHLWMWDEKALTHELAAAQFQNIRRAEFGDSPHETFAQVELQGRWDGCLGLQAEKITN